MARPEAYIYVQKDGVPLHRHPGHPKLHGPWEMHGTAEETQKLHNHPLLLADYIELTEAQKADYDSGENLSHRWLNRYKTDDHKANHYKPRPGAKKAAVVEAEEILAEPMPDILEAALG